MGKEKQIDFAYCPSQGESREPMHKMFRVIRRVVDETPDIKMIYPIHMNPVASKAADDELGDDGRIHINRTA